MTIIVTDSVLFQKLLTVEDVMANLRISRPTLYRLLKTGQLVPVRIGKRTLFDPADIRSFIETSKKTNPKIDKPPQKQQKNKAKANTRDIVTKAKDTKKKKAETPGQNPIEEPSKKKKTKVSDDSNKQGRLL
jgi:excisionase family DNA binding protein